MPQPRIICRELTKCQSKDHNGGTKQQTNPYVFPCLHPALRRLPPTYIAVCDLDPVRDDGTVLKYNLDKYGSVAILSSPPLPPTSPRAKSVMSLANLDRLD